VLKRKIPSSCQNRTLEPWSSSL